MKVLIADDDPGVRLVACTVARGLGHEVAEAASGQEAWAMYQKIRPQVLVTDRLMPPGPDGLQLCRAVRETEQNGNYTYIVLLTSLGRQNEVLEGVEAGADDYVVKPLDPFALHSRLLVADRVTSMHAELSRARAELARQARTDPLTGLNNRSTLGEDLANLHARSVRYGRSYSLALCDLDFFKEYNDTYGHQRGDQALQTIAVALASGARRGEEIYRYGGEEFLMVLPEQTPADAAAALERFRANVETLALEHSGAPAGVLTISVGIASYVPGSQASSEDLLRLADLALYESKAGGRNRVVVSVDAPSEVRS